MLETIGNRLLGRLPMLIIVALTLAALAATGHFALGPALIGFIIIFCAALALPLPPGPAKAPSVAASQATGTRIANFSALADALADPCFILDRRSIVVHKNPAASQQYPSTIIGMPISFSVRNPTLVSAIDAVARKGEMHAVELHETVPSETWSRVVVSPLLVAGKDWLNDERRLTVITVQSLTELKRADAMRKDFIANASHELRTPLTSLLGFIDTLLGPAAKDPQAQARFLVIMRNQAERMAKLIEDLLSLSRIEMHQHVRPTDLVDLATLLHDVRDGLQTQANDSDVTINLSLDAAAAEITGDRDQLYEVFENLIENAIKYGSAGRLVDVVLSAAARRPGFDYMITVTDYGPGIEHEHVPRLTERFYRVDADTSRKKKGTGLGLAIVKHILTRHRGVLSIKSSPGKGMRVEVLLPR